MTDLSPESRALLKGAREDFEASDDERARVGRALAARLGVAVGTAAATTTAVSASAAGSAAAGTTGVAAGAGAAGSALLAGTKWLGAVLLVGGLGAGGVSAYRAARSAPSLPSTPVATAAPQLHAPSVRGPVSAPEAVTPLGDAPAEAPVSPPRRTAPLQEAPPAGRALARESAPAGTVAAETRLLRRAEESLRSGDAAHALALLDEHARTFPNGILTEERSAERVLTLCKLGRTSEAREEAARFLRATPESPLADSVRSSCGSSDEGRGR